MFSPSFWPSTPAHAARLRQFQASPEFAAATPVSTFWERHGSATRVEIDGGRAAVHAGFSFGAPGERPRRLPPGPERVWRRLRPSVAEARAQRDLGRRARASFQAGDVADETLTLLPEYRELVATAHAAPVPLYRYATYLNSFVPQVDPGGTLLEIGPGSGLLALGARRLLDEKRAILVDLPQMLAVAFTVLGYFCGDDAVVLPHELDKGLPETGYVLLTPEQIDFVPADGVRLALNTGSFQEMPYPVIARYFDAIERACEPGGWFYCANEDVCRKIPGEPIEFDRYPWRDGWEIVFDRHVEFVRAVVGERLRERLVRIG